MDSLIGLVGFHSSVGAADSGLYITDLPDISMELLSKLTDSETEDASSVFSEIEKRAVLKFVTLFSVELNKCFKINNREKVECLITENKTLLAVSLWYLMGAETMTERINSSRTNRYTTFDKGKASDLRDSFIGDFATELGNAISGIDISKNICFPDEQIVNNDLIHTQYSMP